MTQREVTDQDSTQWTCVQAYAGAMQDEKTAEAATELASNGNGKVPVVCTPSGGAQTVRVELPKNWLEELPDEELLAEIKAAQQNGQV
ncbi:hypothetical protein [Pontibacter akesuensis]|uniref:Uncharacterized protein n=1 Tax=Pontibacter akesuensis TaxID=388950 RepID=A0A1I7GD59_9BACT|nr:hypothetical protein [Pontibacter akesuensis]GHA57477.1 hypothetical protein GCM10007389_06470 [Pontibacter akesuensis]SFU46358.1 hypothetical protein SAMN04487941_0924 [Pontibacter akesuensis]